MYAVYTLIALMSLISSALVMINLGAEGGWAAGECGVPLQTKIDAAPVGGTVRADACIYREQVRITKPLTLVGQPGSEIRGSEVWGGWTKLGSGDFKTSRSLPAFPQEDVSCERNTKRCAWPEQVFVNGVSQVQVGSGSDPAAGQFKVDRRDRIYNVLSAGGAIERVSSFLERLEPEKVALAVGVVVGVAPFFESVTEFGVAVMINAPILLAAGFSPLRAAVLSSWGQCAVPWGWAPLSALTSRG